MKTFLLAVFAAGLCLALLVSILSLRHILPRVSVRSEQSGIRFTDRNRLEFYRLLWTNKTWRIKETNLLQDGFVVDRLRKIEFVLTPQVQQSYVFTNEQGETYKSYGYDYHPDTGTLQIKVQIAESLLASEVAPAVINASFAHALYFVSYDAHVTAPVETLPGEGEFLAYTRRIPDSIDRYSQGQRWLVRVAR